MGAVVMLSGVSGPGEVEVVESVYACDPKSMVIMEICNIRFHRLAVRGTTTHVCFDDIGKCCAAYTEGDVDYLINCGMSRFKGVVSKDPANVFMCSI